MEAIANRVEAITTSSKKLLVAFLLTRQVVLKVSAAADPWPLLNEVMQVLCIQSTWEATDSRKGTLEELFRIPG